MADEEKPKRAKRAAAPKAAKSVEELVAHALRTAATKPGAKWTAASAAGLFNTKEPNHEAAMKSCLDPTRPLLRQAGAGGTLTSAGFELVAAELPPEEVVPLAVNVLNTLPLDEREGFIASVIGRTPQASAELTPLLADVITAAKADADKKVAAAEKRKREHDAAVQALETAKRLLAESLESQKAALRRQYEALGGSANELRDPTPAPKAEPRREDTRTEPAEDRDFRRDVAAQLAASWRATWEMDKPDAREFLESAMWNISGFKLLGEPGESVTYSGRIHESVAGVFAGDPVKIVRPGWALEEDAGEFVVLKATVAK